MASFEDSVLSCMDLCPQDKPDREITLVLYAQEVLISQSVCVSACQCSV